jgi:RNA polymerase sigma factor (sigma-70 family)
MTRGLIDARRAGKFELDPMTRDSTSPGRGRAFPATHHSVLVGLASDDGERRRRAWDTLVAAYWRPAYCHVRLRWNHSREDAQDLTQEFFLRAFEGNFFDDYDPSRARFRSFLRTCLDRFLAKDRRDAARQKRGGDITFLPLDVGEIEAELTTIQGSDLDPDLRFRQEWIRSLFLLAVDALRAQCEAAGKQAHFTLFERADLLAESGSAAPSYRELAAHSGLSVTQVTNYLAFARREFRRHALDRLAQLCGSDAEYRAEAHELFGINPP